MANGFEAVMKRKEGGVVGKLGSRRIFAPQFKLQVLESYRRDTDCRGNQRATARKYGIHRRQIQKWLQAESSLRAGLARRAPHSQEPALEVRLSDVPVDLSVQRRRVDEPMDNSPMHCENSPSPSYNSSCESCEAWDLSRQPPPTPKPAIKLFRPYLLDEEDEKRPSAFEAVQPRHTYSYCGEFQVHRWLQQSLQHPTKC